MRKLIPIARVGQLAERETKVFRFGARMGLAICIDGEVRAYENACTHMGGPVEMCASGVLRCRWHEAEFDPATGIRLCGQAPEGTALQRIPLQIEDGQICAIFEWNDPFG